MNKCSIDDKSLKLIQSRVAIIFREYLKNESTQEELKKKIKNELDKITSQDNILSIKSDHFSYLTISINKTELLPDILFLISFISDL